MKCDRDSVTYAIATYPSVDDKQKGLDLLKGLIGTTDTQYSFCDGGQWIVSANLNIQDKPTAQQSMKLKRAAQTAHSQIGCQVVTLGGNGAGGSAGSGGSGGSAGATVTATAASS